jgi:hypothetical protein
MTCSSLSQMIWVSWTPPGQESLLMATVGWAGAAVCAQAGAISNPKTTTTAKNRVRNMFHLLERET